MDRRRKRTGDDKSPTVSKKRTLPDSVSSDKSLNCLATVKAFILPAGIEKMRLQIFETQLKKYGGTVLKLYDNQATHLIVDDKMEPNRLCRILKIASPPTRVKIVKSSWLSACFKRKELLCFDDYRLDCSTYIKSKEPDLSFAKEKATAASNSESTVGGNVKTKNMLPKAGFMFGHHSKNNIPASADDDDSDYCPSDGEGKPGDPSSGNNEFAVSPQKELPVGNWVCAQSSKTPVENQNKHITDILEEMVKTYESTNDKWRAFGYQKAIQVLRKHPKPIKSFEEAMNLPSIGKRLAEKIWEIAESGELRKLKELRSSEELKVIETFQNVWGAGAHTARTWYQQGLRTLDDVREQGNLTHQQQVGLHCYNDFLDRMPRAEAAEIEQVVCEAAKSLQEGVIAQACGSFRRGKATCGDVDVLVTHPDGKSHKGLFGKLLAKLKELGFLTDDLVTAEDNGNQKKYLGVCKLPGEGRKHRRLDLIVVPYDEYACALVYFTGSAHLNRSLRHLAKKMNMSLSEHSLNVGVVRRGSEKIYEGTPVPTPTEESVFVKLGVPYRPPEERDH
ncbi:DNA polymerase lambda-like [Mya arenaria]|uniref:DNA polymerase lambda-like n=1 Tax=Mya arenaria TaxID=6604 RepID=UPI0022E6CA1C|nr:DNA polymerase lambda-like [Mya arenaria]